MSKQSSSKIPEDFLSTPAGNISASVIDFSKTTLPIYKDRFAVVLDNVLSPDECQLLIDAAEAGAPNGWQRAMVNVGGGRQALDEDTRNCGRIIWDSRDIVGRLWKRIEHVPEMQDVVQLQDRPLVTGRTAAMRGDVWTFSRPNERMRFLKYVGGEYFRPHCDGVYETPDKKERSWFTLHLYLNGDDPQPSAHLVATEQGDQAAPLIGGATIFHDYHINSQNDVSVYPKAGRVLVFQHRDLCHSGDDVVQGVKYTMRTDLMYSLTSTKRK